MRWWIFIFILLLACGFVKPIFATGVAPATIDLENAPGAVLNQEITIINTKDTDQTYYLDSREFTAQDNESGSPKFLSSKNKTGLSQWLSFQNKEIIIPARSYAEVPFSIIIPLGTPAGSYFAAVTVSENPSEIVATNGATIQAETASLIFLTVTGETELAGALLDFQLEPIDTNQILGSYQFRIQNQGNVYFVPQATITLKDIIGRIILTTSANEQAGRVLPKSTRSFSGVFGEEHGKNFWEILKHQFSIFTIGPITAQLNVLIGENSTPLAASETFVYIPWELLGLITLAIILVLFVYLMNKKQKK